VTQSPLALFGSPAAQLISGVEKSLFKEHHRYEPSHSWSVPDVQKSLPTKGAYSAICLFSIYMLPKKMVLFYTSKIRGHAFMFCFEFNSKQSHSNRNAFLGSFHMGDENLI